MNFFVGAAGKDLFSKEKHAFDKIKKSYTAICFPETFWMKRTHRDTHFAGIKTPKQFRIVLFSGVF